MLINGRELARLMRIGIKLRAVQLFNSYVSPVGSCAAQALIDGYRFEKGRFQVQSQVATIVAANCAEAYELAKTTGLHELVACPLHRPEVRHGRCGGERLRLFDILIHLNDIHRWRREEVADWLESNFVLGSTRVPEPKRDVIPFWPGEAQPAPEPEPEYELVGV